MMRSSVGLILSAIVVSGIISVNCQVNTEWRPPRLAKLYQPGEPTYISTPGDGNHYAWYTVEDRRQFVFQVKTCSGAILAFGTFVNGVESFAVDIGLGIHGNRRSLIREAGNPTSEFLTATPYLLHCNEFRTFWVKWGGDYFVVGRGPIVDEQIFMNWRHPNPDLFFNAIGITSTNGTSAIWRISENSGDRLIVETLDEHRYKTVWKSVQDRTFWTFGVRAGGDVHVILSEKLEVTDVNIYEFVIGGWLNNRSLIRTQVLGGGDSVKASIDIKNIVSTSETREFWISWWNGSIELGRGAIYGKGRLLQWRDVRPISVRYLSVTTGFGNNGVWVIQDDQESMSYIFTSPITSTAPEIKYNMTWVSSPREEFFSFGVKTCTEASILLADMLAVDGKYGIEIVIGAESNTLALFRFLGSPDTIAVVYSTFLVDCDGIRHFWISWHEGIVRLGTGLVYSANVILEKQVFDPNPSKGGFRVGALALSTPLSEGEWRIRETAGERLHVRLPANFNHFGFIWRSVGQREYFLFSVRACSDCHVALSPTLGVDYGETYLDMVIGGWTNSISQIRKVIGNTGREDFSVPVPTPNLLDCNRHINLWVSWNDMKLRLGRGAVPGFHEILVHPLTSPYPVKAVSFSSWANYPGDFIVEEDIGDYLMFYTSLNDKLRWMELASYVTWLSVKIRACSTVYMYLCPTVQSSEDASTQDCYSVVLADQNNTRSTLSKGTTKFQDVDTPDMFNCLDDRHFWIQWSSDGLDIGHGTIPGQNKFMVCDVCRDVTIASIGFNSIQGDYYSRWQIQRNMIVSMSFYSPTAFTYETVWESVEHRRGITFGVTACSDVHVVLSHTVRNFTSAYDVVIGGDHNTRSMIRVGQNYDYVKLETPDILSCTERRFFWLTWQNGAIEAGRGEMIGKMKFIDFQPLQLYNVRAIGFSTGWGYDGHWYLKQGLMPTDAPVTERPDSLETDPPLVGNGTAPDTVAGIVLGVIGGILLVILLFLFIRRYSSNETPLVQ